MGDRDESRRWTVLLIGGNSGVGKTIVARELGLQLGVPWAQLDDFRLVMQRTIPPDQQPALHTFLGDEFSWQLSPETLCERLIAVGQIVSAALEIVIANHVATNEALILEGDGIIPALAAQSVFARLEIHDQVRAVFVVESDQSALLNNMRTRGRGFEQFSATEQQTQARTSWLYGQWLRNEAMYFGLPVIAAQPWRTLANRIRAAL